MKTFTFNAARVSTQFESKSGLCEAIYSGPMTAKAFSALRFEALQASLKTAVYVVRMDRALIAMSDGPPVDDGSYAEDTAPGALIVRPDQYQAFQEYALKASAFGIVRTVWTEANSRLAYEWALRRACLRTAELPHSLPFPQLSSLADL